MTKHDNFNTNRVLIKWMAATMILLMGLFLLTACGTKTEDQKSDDGKPAVSQEQQTGSDASAKDQTSAKTQTDEKAATDKTIDGTPSTTGGETTTAKNDAGATEKTETPDTATETCTIQINCSLLLGQNLSGTGLETLVPADGMILPTTKVTIKPGDTVYDVTLRTVKAKKIQMSSQGTAAMGTLYVEAISNIYEKAFNVKSGWIYLVNGKKPAVSCGLEKIKANDKLVWAYSLSLGSDL